MGTPVWKEATGRCGMVATAFPAATEAGCDILRGGGNAVDAAVAAAWALSVCEPSGSGLGGHTTLLIRRTDGQTSFIDGHSRAPAAVSAARVSRNEQKYGYKACTIPATPATLGFAHRRYGRLSRERVLEPAIRLAEEGYQITAMQHRHLQWCRRALLATPAACQFFLRRGWPPLIGSLFRQKELATTLRRLARDGTEDFYQGAIARAIVDDMEENDGLIARADLEEFDLPVERSPVCASCYGYEVVSAPPPNGGLQLLLGLKLGERLALDASADAGAWYARLAEVTRSVFREREVLFLNPEYSCALLWESLLSDDYVAELAGALSREPRRNAAPSRPEEAGETTHLCTADGEGNVVSLTQSIQSLFGAKVANSRCGFLYNNYLTTCPRTHHVHGLRGGCIPRSNASPTLLMETTKCAEARQPGCGKRQHNSLLVLGAAGSRRITSSLLNVIGAVIERQMPLGEALAMPRAHATLNGEVWIERPAVTDQVRRRLEQRFQQVRVRGPLSFSMGAVQAIQLRPDGAFVGAADPRRDGSAKGIPVPDRAAAAAGEKRSI